MSDPAPELRINKKKLENLERIKKKKDARISKNKQKKLAQIVERKRVKQTRESLIDELQQYQLDAECAKLLSTLSSNKKSNEIPQQVDDYGNPSSSSGFPKKLRCVSTEQMQNNGVKRQQKGYIETDSSSSGSGDEREPELAKLDGGGVVQDEDVQILDLDDKTHEIVDNNRELTFKDNSQKVLQQIYQEEEELILKARQKKKKLQNQAADKNYYEILAKIKGPTVFVKRSREIEQQRRLLPINAEEQPIMEAINDNPVVIICGETGSGKTTQVPQFLYEAGYTSNGHLIAVTEPRRIAAISMAARVGEELGASELASYQIRYEGNRTDRTKLLFMTDGVLLKELQEDCTLSAYSVVVIDEAHERSIYSDVLIGLLSRICLTRLKREYPLKLVIMSATLRLNDFLQERLFPNIRPKVLNVDSRQFPVSIYFERRTPENYLEAALRKVSKIHEQYPAGGILVFLSGQNEVNHLVKQLERKYPQLSKGHAESKQQSWRKVPPGRKRRKSHGKSPPKEEEEEEDLVLDYDEFGTYDMDVDEDNCGLEDGPDRAQAEQLENDQARARFPALHCLPLYSLLPSHVQKRVFHPPPAGEEGARLCVVATNVAETSLTIPNIRYVVDCGKEKRRDYDPVTGVSRFVVDWCSKASANQRSGRAGRVQSGYTFRLYSSAVYEDMLAHSTPEILNKPIEQLVLFLKSMGFSRLANFPFPTAPRPDQIKAAEARLTMLGALTAPKNKDETGQITSLGRTLVQIPLAPGFAKLLVCSHRERLLPYAITLVSALSVREPLIPVSAIHEDSVEETKARMTEMLKQRRLWCSLGEAKLFGDLTVLLNVIGAADYENSKDHKTLAALGLRPKALDEINKLRSQLVTLLNTSTSLAEKLPGEFRMQPPGQEHLRQLRQILAKCFPEKIAKRVEEADAPKGAYKAQLLEEFVFIDTASMLSKEQPDFVLYQEIIQVAEKKVMQSLAVVEPEWVPEFVNFQGILWRF